MSALSRVHRQTALLCLLSCQLFCTCGFRESPYRFDSSRAVHPQFSAERAFRHVEAQVAFGPRPSGSQALKKCSAYLQDQLVNSGWTVQTQEFTEKTPLGSLSFRNLRARFPGPAKSDV